MSMSSFLHKIEKAKDIIVKFDTAPDLDKFIAYQLIEEFQKEGLILLAAGNTFEKSIYSLVNKYFFDDQNKAKIHSGLRLSHIDEVISNKAQGKFSTNIKAALVNLDSPSFNVEENFYSIDTREPEAFDRFIKSQKGPRLIYMGLGSNPDIAHVAYIGEEYINSCTTKVKLSSHEAQKQQCSEAISIGTDIFEYPSIEELRIIVQGYNKAESLKAAFQNPDTGLGYLLEEHFNKVKIYCDHAALSSIKAELK